ncbi:MAG: hypothetical protein M0Q43_11885 [Methanothrix sp.]|nr:hypothetical protein [Methanothrix sp.]
MRSSHFICKSLPIREGFDLRVTGAPAGMALWRGRALSGQRRCDGRLLLPGPSARAAKPQSVRERVGRAWTKKILNSIKLPKTNPLD